MMHYTRIEQNGHSMGGNLKKNCSKTFTTDIPMIFYHIVLDVSGKT